MGTSWCYSVFILCCSVSFGLYNSCKERSWRKPCYFCSWRDAMYCRRGHPIRNCAVSFGSYNSCKERSWRKPCYFCSWRDAMFVSSRTSHTQLLFSHCELATPLQALFSKMLGVGVFSQAPLYDDNCHWTASRKHIGWAILQGASLGSYRESGKSR